MDLRLTGLGGLTGLGPLKPVSLMGLGPPKPVSLMGLGWISSDLNPLDVKGHPKAIL